MAFHVQHGAEVRERGLALDLQVPHFKDLQWRLDVQVREVPHLPGASGSPLSERRKGSRGEVAAAEWLLLRALLLLLLA